MSRGALLLPLLRCLLLHEGDKALHCWLDAVPFTYLLTRPICSRLPALLAAGYFSLSLASLQPGMYRFNMLHASTGAPEPHCWVKVRPRPAISPLWSSALCSLLIAARSCSSLQAEVSWSTDPVAE